MRQEKEFQESEERGGVMKLNLFNNRDKGNPPRFCKVCGKRLDIERYSAMTGMNSKFVGGQLYCNKCYSQRHSQFKKR